MIFFCREIILHIFFFLTYLTSIGITQEDYFYSDESSDEFTREHSPFEEERTAHSAKGLQGTKLDELSQKVEDLNVFKRALDNILVPRVSGTESHNKVLNFIVNEFSNLKWHVEKDTFSEKTPIGIITFTNIIASHNPQAKRFLDIACHYDSKYYKGTNNFVGATDSAVPCSMMIHIAHALNPLLEKKKNSELSLRFIFFDGEEAFRSWSRTDSLYGSRHLAKKWKNTPYIVKGRKATQLDRIDMLVLLDLLGARQPEFYSFFPKTLRHYKVFANAETKLSNKNLLTGYNKKYFQRKSTDTSTEDDHIPFLELGVPVVHIITIPFPPEWHTPRDNRNIIDFHTTSNLIKIITVFIAEYLHLPV